MNLIFRRSTKIKVLDFGVVSKGIIRLFSLRYLINKTTVSTYFKNCIKKMDETDIPDFVRLQINNYIQVNLDKNSNKEESESIHKPKKTMLEKLEDTAPYNIFFNKIELPEMEEDPNSVTFTDLLCPSLGELKCSLQLNFMVDFEWLIQQYKMKNLGEKPLTVVYGPRLFKKDKPDEVNDPNVTMHRMNVPTELFLDKNLHNSKIGIYLYEDDSLRVVVSTANLYEKDWTTCNHQLWMSPRLPPGSTETAGESPTGFKSSLLNYLRQYKLEILAPWLNRVKNADFSQVRVFLVFSTPGCHPPQYPRSHLQRMGTLLLRHCELPARGAILWPVVAQASAMGVFGESPDAWLARIWKVLSGHRRMRTNSKVGPALRVIYPTVKNLLDGHYDPTVATCLHYENEPHLQQKWITSYLCQWKAGDRSGAMPHQKNYFRVSPCGGKLAWFLLTSANLTRSAWGNFMERSGRVSVRNFEAGVLFLPRFFEKEFFDVGAFPFMYDWPLVKYEEDDYPWCDCAQAYYLKRREEFSDDGSV